MSRGSALTKKCDLSDDLSVFMGKETASRAEVIKAVWAHIKKHKLQDPNKRRIIHPDDELAQIIGSASIDMMKMTGKISKHIG